MSEPFVSAAATAALFKLPEAAAVLAFLSRFTTFFSKTCWA